MDMTAADRYAGRFPTWPELAYRLTHCDVCACHVERQREGCACDCHGEATA